MDDHRRYDEDEVRRIFDAATDAEATGRTAVPADGFTLAELQEIGAEVGISRELVTRAAQALAGGGEPGPPGAVGVAVAGETAFHRVLGFPLGLERAVHLPRMLTDEEWAQIVMDARRRFGAPGRVDGAGSLREWRNGNLHISLAPSGEGAVLSMGTRKGNAGPLAGVAGFFLAFATVLLVVMVLTGEIAAAGAIVAPAIIGSMALGALGVNLLGLPPWARRRAAQLEDIGALAQELAARPRGGGGELPPG